MQKQKSVNLPNELRIASRQAAQRLRRDDLALAVSLVESYFRPRIYRVAEYVSWLCLKTYRPVLASKLTIGISQVQVNIINQFLSNQGKKLTLWNLLVYCEDLDKATNITAYYLVNFPYTTSISEDYTGLYNPYYEELVHDVIQELSNTLQQTSN